MKKIIRFANLNDAADILKIYEKFIKETVVTFEIEVPSIESFQNRMKSIQKHLLALCTRLQMIQLHT